MQEIVLPTLHAGQVDIFERRSRLNVVCCGRRWGKTKLLTCLAGNAAANGRKAGIFTPEHKQWAEPWDELYEMLLPIKRIAAKNDAKMRTTTGGFLDFWATTDNHLAGRGREYHLGMMDEAAFSKNGQMLEIWRRSIEPTLLTTRGSFWLFSTPNGVDPDNFFYQAWHDPALGFKQFHAPTATNPYVPPDELEKKRSEVHPLVFQQEYLAEFVSWNSSTFFKESYFMGADGLPVAYPAKCDAVFAIMDCAAKSGTNNDATGVLYCSVSRYHGEKLIWLDYEMHSIDASMLEYLAPKVLKRCEELAAQCGARNGSLGLFVEDAAGGIVLNQQARAKGWPVTPIPSDLMAKGKDERAMIAGGPAYRGDCKISRYAFDKRMEWKGRTMNHLMNQVCMFRVGDKDAYKREDDLLDCATYSIALTLAEAGALGK